MTLKRRDFIRIGTGSAVASTALVAGLSSCATPAAPEASPLDRLKSMTDDIVPINAADRRARIEKAQRLMAENKIEALLLDSGTSMKYFTGVNWWPSERTMVAIVPARGEVFYISPAFEADRLRQLITLGKDVKTWEEHESPYALIATALKDAGIRNGNIGIEERLRFFIFDGVRKEATHLNFLSADPVTIPCRLIKSPKELALMQRATDITIEAHKTNVAVLQEGMSPEDFGKIAEEAHARMGATGGTGVNFGEASAYPHGSIEPQKLKKGDIVLMDGGCSVGGYASDISRTVVFGVAPTARQREIWDLEKKAQAAGFAAAKIGDPCENVDIAARKVLEDAGFGPGYKVPGLPHRTGHGIGMDGHEWGNMVLGNKLTLQPGMCFSVEPNISIYGEFGVRLEDCVYMTEEGPKWFSQPSPAIDVPFA